MKMEMYIYYIFSSWRCTVYVINLVIKKQNPAELGLIQHFLHDCAREPASSSLPRGAHLGKGLSMSVTSQKLQTEEQTAVIPKETEVEALTHRPWRIMKTLFVV